jgi:hypothetical protein
MAYSNARVFSGAGTLYAAPLGTTEPTAVTGAWPTGWVTLGYTSQGSTFESQKQTATVTAEEEYYPLRIVTTGATARLTFNLEEYTAANLALAQNGGVGTASGGVLTGLVSGTSGTNPDGSIWVESPPIGYEARIMLGWDYLPEGGTTLPSGGTAGRLIVRQCLQSGNTQIQRRKGANAATIACQFDAEKPPGVNPFRFILPAVLAA